MHSLEPLSFVLLWSGLLNPACPDAETQIKRLDSSVFKVREEATHKLRQLGWQAIPSLEYAIRHANLETAKRCQSVLKKYYDRHTFPWMHGTTPNMIPILNAYLNGCANKPHGLEQYLEFRLALYHWRRDLLRLGIPPKWLEPYIMEAEKHERDYKKDKHPKTSYFIPASNGNNERSAGTRLRV